MVGGLDRFREHFKGFERRYILIGGAACDIWFDEAGLPFRATRDLDLVLCVEALDRGFAKAFWDFVRAGGYQVWQGSEGERRFYRFQQPETDGYPEMLELFSRAPDALTPAEGSHLTPIPIDESVSSLSAILLDDDYYGWIQAGQEGREGLSVVTPLHLIPLKARAWIDLTRRRAAGEKGQSKHIKKHKNDVFRLFQLVSPEARPTVPEAVRRDLGRFLAGVGDQGVDLKALGIGVALAEALASLRAIYGVETR